MLVDSRDTAPDSADTAMRPDNWSPQQQMARMLELCEAQMSAAIGDSDHAVDALVGAFTEVVATARALSELVASLPPEIRQHAAATDIDRRCAALSERVQSAVVAFQFYDKLSQRLGHVRYSLSAVAEFSCDLQYASQPKQWQELLMTLRSLYRTAEERVVFERVTGAAGTRPQATDSMDVNGDIELF